MYARLPEFTPRKFTRREKTIIRQDVKRFEKIGRDHGCTTLEEYAEYVAERTHRDADGYLTQKSFELFRALGAYFGEQLLYNTTMTRATCNVQVRKADDRLTQDMVASNPGWLLADMKVKQSVIVPYVMIERLFPVSPWTESLDDLLDQIIDWNHGYLLQEEINTAWVAGYDLEPVGFLAA